MSMPSRTFPERLSVVGVKPTYRTWPVSLTPIDEDDAGTYYSDWQDLTDGPVAVGWFAAPDSDISQSTDTTYNAWLQLADESGAIIDTVLMATMVGKAERDGSGFAPQVFRLDDTSRRKIAKIRWRVTGGDDLTWELVGGSFYALGTRAPLCRWRGSLPGRHVPVMRANAIRVWELSALSAANGTGPETVYTPYFVIPSPQPYGSGLFGVPGVQIETDGGGDIDATIEFWDDSSKLTEAAIASLTAVDIQQPQTVTDYTLPDIGAITESADQTGTFYSAWSNLAIPASPTAMLIFGSAALDGSTFTSSLSIEFGDAGGNVVGSVDILSCSGGADCTTTPATATFSMISVPATAKVRVKLVVSSASGGVWLSGSISQMLIRRFS